MRQENLDLFKRLFVAYELHRDIEHSAMETAIRWAHLVESNASNENFSVIKQCYSDALAAMTLSQKNRENSYSQLEDFIAKNLK
jgi:hypothetical protein